MALLDRAFAASYDRITAPIERRWLAEARHQLLSGLTGRVLEIGAGTGANFRYYPPHAQVTAVEPSPHFLRRARIKLAEAQATIELRQADAQVLPFGDDMFGAAVATLVFCSIPDPARALEEIRRVSVAGAPLLLIEHVRARTAGGQLMQNLWNPCQKTLGRGCHLNRDTAATVRTAGFQVEEVRELAVEWWGLMPIILIRASNAKDGSVPGLPGPPR